MSSASKEGAQKPSGNSGKQKTEHQAQLAEQFAQIASQQPQNIWSQHLDSKTTRAISDYLGHRKLRSGKIYGESVRTLDLRGKCPEDLKKTLQQQQQCLLQNDFIKNSRTHAPMLDSQGQKIPMLVYLCPDGGVVRIKPSGDPTSRFRPQPHASKALRYPFDASFESFDDERVKIDHSGNPIPKWAKDLNPELSLPNGREELVESWAEDAHADLGLDCRR